MIVHCFDLDSNWASDPDAVTMTVVSFLSYPNPPLTTVIDSITPAFNTGMRIHPLPDPLTSKVGGLLYSDPELRTKTSTILPFATTGFNWAEVPVFRVKTGWRL